MQMFHNFAVEVSMAERSQPAMVGSWMWHRSFQGGRDTVKPVGSPVEDGGFKVKI